MYDKIYYMKKRINILWMLICQKTFIYVCMSNINKWNVMWNVSNHMMAKTNKAKYR